MQTALLIYHYKYTHNTWAVLTGALEHDSYFDEYEINYCMRAENLLHELHKLQKKYTRIVIAFSFATPQYWNICEIMQNMPKNQNLLYIAGGPHPTGDPKSTFQLGFDVLTIGEGEETFPEILKAWEEEQDYRHIQGIAYQEDEEIIYTSQREPIHLDDYPPFGWKHEKFGHIEIMRGCPIGCAFCQTAQLFPRKPRYRSVEKVCEAIEIMLHHGLHYVRFIAPNAFGYGNGTVQELEHFLQRTRETLGSKGELFLGSFPSEVRPEDVTQEKLDLIRQYANNNNFTVGAQTGSPRLLKFCNRGHTVEHIYQAVQLIRQNNFEVSVDFIFGLPTETLDDCRMTMNMIQDLVNMGARIHAHTFLPLPGTKFERETAMPFPKEFEYERERLISQGVIFGHWRRQSIVSEKISSTI
ncbi:MAG: TIGR04013 family B12-binding domain/radical SAM domain-containing protein [Planctomycetes bacterium]|jgi:B12-binding domain/radical SAM domain protein|nr:TIGR04013 family B12-binding domain/radical SAM domain-containing protein [Planctomycetota bacterium]